jgi:hypothetical protein
MVKASSHAAICGDAARVGGNETGAENAQVEQDAPS